MSLDIRTLEKLELKYLDVIYETATANLKEILDRFYLRIKAYEFWKKQHLVGEEIKRLSDLGVGAERVFHHLFARDTNWLPCSIPVGSDLFYENEEAFINIDIKSDYVENSWDYLGVAEVGERQTSYRMQNKWGAKAKFLPQLPPYYKIGEVKKPCLTFIIQIIHVDIDHIVKKKYDPNFIALIVLAIPNQLLYERYKEKIIEEPKSYHKKAGKRYRAANFRFAYHKYPWFAALKTKFSAECRFRLLFNEKYLGKSFVTAYKFNNKLTLKMLPEKVTQIKKSVVKTATHLFEKKERKVLLVDY